MKPARRGHAVHVGFLLLIFLATQWLVNSHVHDQKNLSTDSVCAYCVSADNFGHGVVNASIPFTIATGEPQLAVPMRMSYHSVSRTGFSARAPPLFSKFC